MTRHHPDGHTEHLFSQDTVTKSSLAITPYSPITDYPGCRIEFVILYRTLIDNWFFFSNNLYYFVEVEITFSTLDFFSCFS